MRNYLIPDTGQFYKANLHCHSTVSDGRLTPEELKAAYQKEGYSILAFTDHEVLVHHNELTDASFLALSGYEIAVNEDSDRPGSQKKTCHVNLYAKSPEIRRQVCFHPDYLMGNSRKHLTSVEYNGQLFIREYTPDCINSIVRQATEGGFLVAYNHPFWSLETLYEYGNYEGFFAMEIYNNFSHVRDGLFEFNEQIYDSLLRMGKRLYCTATDDNHNLDPQKPLRDSFGGFTMIKAEALTYPAVIQALTDGAFYASCGPLIDALYIEDKTVILHCSPAKEIYMTTSGRRSEMAVAPEGSALTEAVFHLAEEDEYIRFAVADATGKRAYTNAYFADKIF